jgi:hypothetical protein
VIIFTQIGLNPLGDDGVAALLKAVKINKSLKVLSLEVWYEIANVSKYCGI